MMPVSGVALTLLCIVLPVDLCDYYVLHHVPILLSRFSSCALSALLSSADVTQLLVQLYFTDRFICAGHCMLHLSGHSGQLAAA